MGQMKRYAVYYAPRAGAFADHAGRWLGHDVATGAAVAQPDIGLAVEGITRAPRRYGFRGTIKPPFRLAAIGGFLALVPEGETGPLRYPRGASRRGARQLSRVAGPNG